MPIKADGPAELRIVDRWDGGFGWLAHPEEELRRASHALVVDSAERSSAGSRTRSGDGEVWVVDPVDAPGLDDELAEHGDVAGVVVLLGRHTRDAEALANRHDVAVHVPGWMGNVEADLDATVLRFDRELGETDYRAIRVRNSSIPPWREAALYDDAAGTLLVPEAVGTAPLFLASGERLGVHPMLRAFPPRDALGGLSPERVLVGHGEGVFDDAAGALREALDGSRRRALSLYGRTLEEYVRG